MCNISLLHGPPDNLAGQGVDREAADEVVLVAAQLRKSMPSIFSLCRLQMTLSGLSVVGWCSFSSAGSPSAASSASRTAI